MTVVHKFKWNFKSQKFLNKSAFVSCKFLCKIKIKLEINQTNCNYDSKTNYIQPKLKSNMFIQQERQLNLKTLYFLFKICEYDMTR